MRTTDDRPDKTLLTDPLLPPTPPLFGASWPPPTHPPSRRILALAGTAGAVSVVAVPSGWSGIGWPLWFVAVLAVVLVLGWRPRASYAAWAVGALALAVVPAVRDTDWLTGPSVLAACCAASIAVAGPSTRSVLRGATTVPVAAVRALPWVARGVAGLRGGAGTARAAVAVVVGLVLLVVFGALLTSADAAFARLVADLFPATDGQPVVDGLARFGFGALLVAGVAFVLASPREPAAEPAVRERVRGLEWTIPVGALVVLFAAFVATTAGTLFGSDDHVRRTTGLTYAEYARGGFWQLLAVTAMTLGVVVVASRWAPAATAAQRAWKRGLLAALTGLTLLIVASALSRMWLYQQAYGFTVLRLVVTAVEVWLAVGLLLVLAAVLTLRPSGPARGMAAAGVLVLLVLAWLNPDRFVAEHNLTRWASTGELDAFYLEELSADAVPVLTTLPEPLRSCTLAPVARRLAAPESWNGANLSRAQARAVLAVDPAHCGSL